jgi:putative radical SAM enzyme (TIGR03279 family)
MRVLQVEPNSPLFGYIRPGFEIRAVNGSVVEDTIDFRFKIADERIQLLFADQQGKELSFDFENVSADELGLTLDDSRIRVCKNDCIFCFIDQQPAGMRSNLYIKDEDYRLSFTHGNFITLSNTSEQDADRIIAQRLSPLYVSVHATDDTLRRCMLRNEKLADIVPRLKYLGDHGIIIHAQAVLCPGINDGPYLEKTITDLAALYPHVETLAIVPVGLTKFRDGLSRLRNYTPDEGKDIIRIVEGHQKQLLKRLGTRFVWPSDEFYVEAKLPYPKHSEYEVMSQFENGIGMVREAITMFNRRRSRLKGIKSKQRVMFLTGKSAYPFLSKDILPYVTETLNLDLSIVEMTNQFWGEMVTVSGLLTGQDLLRESRKRINEYDIVVLPPNCLNNDNLFLDNLSLEQFRAALAKPVVVGQYDLAATIRESFQVCA